MNPPAIAFPKSRCLGALLLAIALGACSQAHPAASETFAITPHAEFDDPWAMAFLPDGRVLVTEQRGKLKLHTPGREDSSDISGVPEVAYGGQGGLGDIVLHPDFASNQLVYLSYAEAGERGRSGAAVARARLVLDGEGGALRDLSVIWRQEPKVSGNGHFGHRIAFDRDGYLFISSGERQQFDPAQDMQKNLGKILRLNADGSVPADNPFASQGGVGAQIWSLGHRNPLGLAFDAGGQLWNTEMGPRGGDELNRVERGANHGWPVVSNGDHYDGRNIPDHPTQPAYTAPVVFWNPVISPSSLMFYSGTEFPAWQGNAFIGGLSSEALVRIEFSGNTAAEAQRFDMNAGIRAVEQGNDGAIWLLEDGRDGRLLRLARKTN